MSTKLLRGPRARKTRRFLKRHPGSYVDALLPGPDGKLSMVVFGPPTWSDEPYDMPDYTALEVTDRPNNEILCGAKKAADQLTALTEELDLHEDVPTITIVGEPYACKTCGATGDDPCRTKSGKIASKEHSGRTVL